MMYPRHQRQLLGIHIIAVGRASRPLIAGIAPIKEQQGVAICPGKCAPPGPGRLGELIACRWKRKWAGGMRFRIEQIRIDGSDSAGIKPDSKIARIRRPRHKRRDRYIVRRLKIQWVMKIAQGHRWTMIDGAHDLSIGIVWAGHIGNPRLGSGRRLGGAPRSRR